MKKRLIVGAVLISILAVGGYGWHQYHTPDAFMSRGHDLQTQGHFKEAILDYRKAAELSPKDANAHALLAIAYMSINYKMVHYGPAQRPQIYVYRPSLADIQKAIAEYRVAIALKPAYPPYYDSLGGALEYANRDNEALAEYCQALKLSPESRSPWTWIFPVFEWPA